RSAHRRASSARTPAIVPAPSPAGFVGSGLVRGAPAQAAVMIVRHTLKSHRVARYMIRERGTAHLPPGIPQGQHPHNAQRWEGWKNSANVDRGTQRIRPRRFVEMATTRSLATTGDGRSRLR